MSETARQLYEALRTLERRAAAARRAADEVYSRRDTARAVEEEFGVKLDARRISTWLPTDAERAQVPQVVDGPVWAVVQVWSSWAGDPRPSQRHWSDLIEAAQPSRTRLAVTGGGRLWRLAEMTDPFAFDVHRAIEALPTADGVELPMLPVYVSRDHDAKLRDAVRRAVGGASTIVVLVGGSSTGKTRACWEVIHELPDDWRVWQPIDRGTMAEAISQIPPRTVIWLNESHQHLRTTPRDMGERVAAGLRELLRDPRRGPILVLGTIWPEPWGELTADPPRGRPDPHPQARALLSGVTIRLPDTFDGRALSALRIAARTDPRLAEAVTGAEGGGIAQYLAGVPVLLERYRNAPPASRALIDAAKDARRVGHSRPLPSVLLECAALGYLTGQQRDELDENWLEKALVYTAKACRGIRGPLTRTRPLQRQPASGAALYRLTDYLEQASRTSRRAYLVPTELWDALEAHATKTDLADLAQEAERRGLYRHAYRLGMGAAEAGHTDGLYWMSDLLQRVGHFDDAIGQLRAWADAGNEAVPALAALWLHRADRVDEALDMYRRAADGGDVTAAQTGAVLLQKLDRIEDAIEWLRGPAESGDHDAMKMTADLLIRAGRVDEADVFYERAALADEPWHLTESSWLLVDADRIGKAKVKQVEDTIERRLRAQIESGDTHAWHPLSSLLAKTGRVNEAIEKLRAMTESGDFTAWIPLAHVLAGDGQVDEAIALYQPKVAGGDTYALEEATRLLAAAGRIDEAIAICQQAPAGKTYAWELMAGLLAAAGRVDEVVALCRQTAAGNFYALEEATKLLVEAGRVDEAITLCRSAAAGSTDALGRATKLMVKEGRVDEAIAWLRGLADTRNDLAAELATVLMVRTGRAHDAIEWLRRLATSRTPQELRTLAGPLARAGALEDAIDLCTRAASAGEVSTHTSLAALLVRAGRTNEAIILHQRAVAAGETRGLEAAATLLVRAGRSNEAAQLQRFGLEPDGSRADPW